MRSNVTTTIFALAMVSLAIRHAEASYKRLNDYLTGKVDSDDVKANLDAATNWLEAPEAVGCSFSLRIPIADLKRFTSLEKVLEDSRCDRNAYEIMRANEEKVGLNKLIDEGKVTRRVDKVILKIIETHAQRCARVYPITYRLKRNQLDEVVFQRVKLLTTMLMEVDATVLTRHFHYEPTNLFLVYIMHSPSIYRYTGLNILHNALFYSAQGDPNARYVHKVLDKKSGKEVVCKDKLRQLVRRHLIEPCQNYVNLFGPDLFIPARFEARVHSEIDNYDALYYLSWSNFMICQALTKNQAAVYNDVIKSVSGKLIQG